MTEQPDPVVTHNEAANRYELHLGDDLVGFVDYMPSEGMVTFTHTEVEDGHEGQGLGGILVRHALDDVRAKGLEVLPICPFVERWMQRHEEYQDLDYRRRKPE